MRNRSCGLAFLLFLLFLACASVASAQSPSGRALSFGVKGGYNNSFLVADSPDLGQFPRALHTWIVGGFVVIPVAGRLSFAPEVLYSRKGGQVQVAPAPPNPTTVPMADRLDYLAVPLLARLSFGRRSTIRSFVVIGPEIAFLVNARQVPDAGGTAADLGNRTKSTDVGLAFGAGVEVKRFLVEVRSSLGFANIATPGDVKHNVLSVMAGVRF
jgi:hypothetical protein